VQQVTDELYAFLNLIFFIFGACNGFPDATGDAASAEAEEADEYVRCNDGPERQVVSSTVAVVVAGVIIVHHLVVNSEHPNVSANEPYEVEAAQYSVSATCSVVLITLLQTLMTLPLSS